MKNIRIFLPIVAALVVLMAAGCKKEEPIVVKTYAELVNGDAFREAIPEDATAIVFCGNSSDTSDVLLSTEESQYPIYGVRKDTAWCICTSADYINANADCSKMFYGLLKVENITLGEVFNTQNVTDMNLMFGCLWRVTSLDLSKLKTDNVITMSRMFMLSDALKEINLSSFNTANVTDMSAMFLDCQNLTTINLSSFDTKNVTDMMSMFYGCTSLTNVNVSSFNTQNVTDLSGMFRNCSALSTIDLSSFNTSKVTNMVSMFDGCILMDELVLSQFDMSSVEKKSNMFRNLSVETSSCTVTCPSSARDALENGTNIPTTVDIIWVLLDK